MGVRGRVLRAFPSPERMESCVMDPPLLAAAENAREQHRDTLAILPVAVAERRHEIILLEVHSDQDVSRGQDSKQQMTGTHLRRCPEYKEEPQHKRMAHDSVEERRPEDRRSRHDV